MGPVQPVWWLAPRPARFFLRAPFLPADDMLIAKGGKLYSCLLQLKLMTNQQISPFAVEISTRDSA